MGNSVKVTVTLPRALVAEIDKRRGMVPRSKYIAYLLSEAIKSP